MNPIRIPLLCLQDRISTGISPVVSRLCLQAELKSATGDHRWPQTQQNTGLLSRADRDKCHMNHLTNTAHPWVLREGLTTKHPGSKGSSRNSLDRFCSVDHRPIINVILLTQLHYQKHHLEHLLQFANTIKSPCINEFLKKK